MSSQERTKRARRLIDLYALRGKVIAQIAEIEAAITLEAEVVRRQAELTDAEGRKHRRRVAECGTDGGYHRHLRRLKETPCIACKMAHTAAERERNNRKAAS